MKLFPIVGEGPTFEFLAAFTEMLCKYPEWAIQEGLNPSTGIPSQFDYLPALSRIKDTLDRALEARGKVLEEERRFREQMEERLRIEAQHSSREPSKRPYTGPIEKVKPGDIIGGDRMDEYRHFMAKNHGMREIKMWELNEQWRDSGARPFARPTSTAKPSSPPEESNPFEAPQ